MNLMSPELKCRVIQDLNENHGKSLLNLDNCLKLQNTLLQKRNFIKTEIDILNRDSPIGKSIQDIEQNLIKANKITNSSTDIIQNIENNLEEVDVIRKQFENYFDKINILECALQYFKVIQNIEYLNSELQKEVTKKDDEKCTTLFANLTEISRNLTDFKGIHLNNYLKDVIHYWHNVLKEKLSKDFEEILKSIKWPFISTNFSLIVPMPTQVQKLQIITEYLLQIQIPSEISIPDVKPAFLSNFPPLCLPVHFLIQPLKRRFTYHFYGGRQTNKPEKPEWYFTQVLTWIRDHTDFVEKYIQPIVDKLGLHHTDAKLELIRGLVQMGVEKLYSDLPTLQYDDFTFSHAIDEALGFDKELRETYQYPSNEPGILTVLTQAQIFTKWITMEKKYAVEKMDLMLPPNSSEAFEPLTLDVEDLKITTCADAFITLLQTITERYESLPQPGHRLQFLELQLELLDDFRVRLLQLVNAEEGNIIESKIPAIANSIYYIENVLTDWGAMLHYLTLHYYQSQLESPKHSSTHTSIDLDDSLNADLDADTVFVDILSLYKHMRKDLLNSLAETAVAEIKTRSRNYRRERWSTIHVEKEFRSLSLTPSACPMFEILAKRLYQLEKSLQSKLFTYVWRSIATQLDAYLFEELVLENRFSEGGALQFKFDITRNLIPLFAQFTDRPHTYLFQLMESCNLLNISKGSALLLRETLLALEGATGVEDTRGKALKEIGVANFSPAMAIKVLNQRTDITINRILID